MTVTDRTIAGSLALTRRQALTKTDANLSHLGAGMLGASPESLSMDLPH
jgi:hypothetical protein